MDERAAAAKERARACDIGWQYGRVVSESEVDRHGYGIGTGSGHGGVDDGQGRDAAERFPLHVHIRGGGGHGHTDSDAVCLGLGPALGAPGLGQPNHPYSAHSTGSRIIRGGRQEQSSCSPERRCR